MHKSGNVVYRTNSSFSGGINLRALHIAALMSNIYTEKYTQEHITIVDHKVGTFCSQIIVVSTTQFMSSFTHITLRKETEKSRYKRNYSIGVGENLNEKLRDQL
jgi:hypothetical protein